MNKVMLLGRLVKDPEVRYTQGATPIAIARYTLAVNRRYKKEGEPEADFINCIAFGKNGEFAQKWLKKGRMIGIAGRIQVRSWEENGTKRWSTEVVAEEHYFADSKQEQKPESQGFYPIDESAEDEDLPF